MTLHLLVDHIMGLSTLVNKQQTAGRFSPRMFSIFGTCFTLGPRFVPIHSTLAFSVLGWGRPSDGSFSFFFGAALLGASTTLIVRPSICGVCSTTLTSESAAAISFRS